MSLYSLPPPYTLGCCLFAGKAYLESDRRLPSNKGDEILLSLWLIASNILRDAIKYKLGYCSTLRKSTPLVDHIGKVLGTNRPSLIPLERIYTGSRILETGIRSARNEQTHGDAMWTKLCIQASGK